MSQSKITAFFRRDKMIISSFRYRNRNLWFHSQYFLHSKYAFCFLYGLKVSGYRHLINKGSVSGQSMFYSSSWRSAATWAPSTSLILTNSFRNILATPQKINLFWIKDFWNIALKLLLFRLDVLDSKWDYCSTDLDSHCVQGL